MTELLIGAEFVKQGFEIQNGDNESPKPLVLFNGMCIPCECKRKQKDKPSAVKSNINKASNRLRCDCLKFDKNNESN